jgi:hypothetical protein
VPSIRRRYRNLRMVVSVSAWPGARVVVRLASRAQRAATQAVVPCSLSWSQLTGPRRQDTCAVGSFRRLGPVCNACVAGPPGLKASHGAAHGVGPLKTARPEDAARFQFRLEATDKLGRCRSSSPCKLAVQCLPTNPKTETSETGRVEATRKKIQDRISAGFDYSNHTAVLDYG